MKRPLLALCLAAALSPVVAQSPAYEDAQRQAQADSLNPAWREWYLRQMRPAFAGMFQTLMGLCLQATGATAVPSFGLVITVTREGRVDRILWRETSAFTDCLETGLRPALFPEAPTEAFHFGLAVRGNAPGA